MKLYFEEYPYPLDLLQENLDEEVNLSLLNNGKAKIPYVGYYFNAKINDTVFVLPKVFISENGKAFDRYENPEEIIDISPEDNPLKKNSDDEVVFDLSMWLYQAIHHYYERQQNTTIISDVQLQNVRPIGEKDSKTIIEIILALREFNKKHRNLFTYISLVKSSGNNKVHWNKTISKVRPIIKDGSPYYMEFQNKNKVINFDEELICLFYSVLNYLSLTYHFKFQQVSGFTILKSSKIKSLIESGKGTRLLKKIRRNYFTDELVELWNLLYVFFERAELVASGKSYHEKLLVSNFNRVFEDMIDQLLSDDRKDLPKELYDQEDGKLVDHIYKDKSLIDEEKDIYFIGDSKYYKETTDYGKNSIYKQFTYAKNVIQYNINVFSNKDDVKNLRYRDTLTEGYNITPNFFIRGKMDFENPKNHEMEIHKNSDFERHNEHFFNRLFDRDTLFLQSYDINFMYVVTSYVNNSNDVGVKKSLQSLFRKNFISFVESRFEFSMLEPKNLTLREAVDKNFRKLNGKIYKPCDTNELLILALDKNKKFQFENLSLISQIEDDFYIYDYRLGTNPNEAKTNIQYKYFEMDDEISVAAEDEVRYEKSESRYKKYKEEESVLFGIYKDEQHLEWILNNKKYNVRLGNRAGAVKRTSQVINAKYLILYCLDNETNYKIFKLTNKHHIWDTNKMKELSYPTNNDGNQYYIYNILEETTELEITDISTILNKKYEEFEKSTGKKMDKGTPIYVYINEI
ncbi:MAG: hypothetical protein IJZ87_02060 [Bacteroidales bacterium]|nr:hypothetical protein [Bacteroidales bacterium]